MIPVAFKLYGSTEFNLHRPTSAVALLFSALAQRYKLNVKEQSS
jgi:hypothetical protein